MRASKSSFLFTEEKCYVYLITVSKYNWVTGLGLRMKLGFYELCTRNYGDELEALKYGEAIGVLAGPRRARGPRTFQKGPD